MNVYYFIAYRELTDGEVQLIVDHAEHPDTVVFTGALLRAVDRVAKESYARTGLALASAMDEVPL